ALVGLFWGARKGYRTTEDGGDSDPVVIELPQFGDGPRHEIVLEPAHWSNFAKNLTASPARIERPHSYDELADAVRDAVELGYRVKPVGGSFSWSEGAVTDGVMIDMSNLDRPIEVRQADSDRPATVTVEAGMTVHDMTVYAEKHGFTFATTTVIPWVQMGGAVANGCHGTGRDVSTLSDLVTSMDVVGADGTLTTYERDDGNTWRALIVGLGGLGIIYSLTVECIPLYNVHAVDTVMNMPTAVQQMKELYESNENLELFWFPFNQNALVKTWNRTDAPVTEHLPARAWDDLIQAFDDGLSGLLKDVLHVDPGLTPKLCKLMFSMMNKHDVVCPVPWAMQYQTSFAPVLDMGWAIPIDESFDKVRRAWNEAVDQVEEYAHRGLYPQNMVLHARFIGKPSSGLLSPSEGHTLGSAYIEVLTFEKTEHHADYFAELGEKWEKLGGRPHWAKLIYHPTDLAKMYGENLSKFLDVRAELDPEGVFLSDYLEEVLGLDSVRVSAGSAGLNKAKP
ncbi:MAG: hypothetical protein ACI9C1_003132, partial [Candidatus Aldehydirespiratoraceae bacterium]